MNATTTTATDTHGCTGYACPVVHLSRTDAGEAVAAHVADGWSVVATTRDTVRLARLGEAVTITTAPRTAAPWE